MSVAETIRQEILTRQERTRDLAAARRLAVGAPHTTRQT